MLHPPFITLDESSTQPIYQQICEAIRQEILSGNFRPRTPLPASRALAEQLKIARMTVVNAYDQLVAEGYLETRIGAGTFVTSRLPEEYLQAKSARQSEKKIKSEPRKIWLSNFGKRVDEYKERILSDFGGSFPIAFQHGTPDTENFPFKVWEKISAKWLRKTSENFFQYQEPFGYFPLRKAIAEHVVSSRGLRCEPEQVLIINGIQQGLDLISRIFLDGGAEFCVEDPGYAARREFFATDEAKLIPVPLDAEGFNLSAAKKLSRNPRLIYVTPSHQYPLGMTMTLARRMALLEWANETGAFIVEDDYDSEFRYASRPVAALQGLDRHNRVIYLGTFSKTIFPSLRLGCLIAPPDLVEIFAAAKALSDYHSPPLQQAVLAEFIAEKHYLRHLRKMRGIYEQRQQFIIEEAEKRLKGLLEIKPSDAGMHLIGWLPAGVSDREVVRQALSAGLRLKSLSSLCLNEKMRGGLILGYTGFNEEQIRQGIKKLRKVLSEFK